MVVMCECCAAADTANSRLFYVGTKDYRVKMVPSNTEGNDTRGINGVEVFIYQKPSKCAKEPFA